MQAPDGASASPASLSKYRWLVDYVPDTPGVFVTGKQLRDLVLTDAFFALMLAFPPVAGAIGVSSAQAAGIVAIHFVAVSGNGLLLHRLAQRKEWAFHLGLLINVLAGVGCACAFPVLGGDPNTMAWCIPIVYASMNGTLGAETRPSRALLIAAALGPLLTIPAFDWRGDPWGIGGPALAAGLSAGAYHFLAMRTAAVRQLRLLHDETLKQLRAHQEELVRVHLARDLHDSVGSTLGLLSLHAALLERHRDEPDQVGRLAALAREAAQGGLDDLRGVLEAVAPETETLASLATSLEALASRAAPSIRVHVEVGSGEWVEVPGAARLVLVRGFQEALRNAVIHGKAETVRIQLDGDEGIRMTVTDDGVGFLPNSVRKGRGLAGMRTRTEEAGGLFELEASPGKGTRLLFSL